MSLSVPWSKIALVDVEASGLMKGSFPVEVAWTTGTSIDSMLINPDNVWDTGRWDVDAEALHGISIQQLKRSGRHPQIVAATLENTFRGRIVFSDSPSHDSLWLDVLHDAVGVSRTYKVESLGKLLAFMSVTAEEAYGVFETVRKSFDPRGRAEAGVNFLKVVVETATGARRNG